MGFPALRLTQVAFDNVYKFLDVPEIILLSQCSRSMEDLVKSKEDPRKGRQVVVEFYRDFVEVTIMKKIPAFPILRQFRWGIYQPRILPSGKFIEVNGISGKTVKCANVHREWFSVSKRGYFEKDLLCVITMLRDLFNCSIANIDFYHDDVLKGYCFHKLFVETDALRRADSIFVDESWLEPKVMDFIFDNFITDDLTFKGHVRDDYSYQNPLNFPSIFLRYAPWINLEKLLEMSKTGRHITLCETKLISDKDINQFLKNWLSSDNKTLKSVKLARDQSSQNEVAIMEGIAFKKRDIDSSFVRTELNIIRKDGAHATILVKNFGELVISFDQTQMK